jgi:hypothetical protein
VSTGRPSGDEDDGQRDRRAEQDHQHGQDHGGQPAPAKAPAETRSREEYADDVRSAGWGDQPAGSHGMGTMAAAGRSVEGTAEVTAMPRRVRTGRTDRAALAVKTVTVVSMSARRRPGIRVMLVAGVSRRSRGAAEP